MSRRMKVLVTGAAGMLADSLVPALRRAKYSVLPTDIDVSKSGCTHLDVRDFNEVWRFASRSFKPRMIIHLAAKTNLEKCELDPDDAYKNNALGTQNIALACRRLKIPMVYVSTAGVFDGTKQGLYTEFDKPNPINVYGSSKFAGETYVRETVGEHFIIRAGWMIGGGSKDKKFVKMILDQISSGATKIHAVTDKFGTPTYAPAFSRVAVELIKSGFFGTYHLACRGQATRYDVAQEILAVVNREDIDLIPVKSDYFDKEFPAPRPRSEMMRNYVLELRGHDEMPTWQEALRQYLRDYFPEFVGSSDA
jgi:dTDP-4-dehydrorhamnose reductase